MKTIIKYRWAILIAWVAAAILLTAFQPDINSIIRERGQSALNDTSQSVVAQDILEKMETTEGTSDLLVFYDEDQLSEDDIASIQTAVEAIGENQESLGITQIIDPFSMPEAAESLYSEDGTTLMVSVKVDKGEQSVSQLKEKFEGYLKGVESEYYLSGEDFINDDYQTTAESGVEKSAALTVLFILIVLIVVFRSVITPVVSLLGVAMAYLVSNGIGAQLIANANFPVTSLTTMLLILILFGIGTDYNILLFSRFREELGKGESIDNAIIKSYKTAGKTIFFSIITVIIAFAALVLANCPIYQSGAIVVIGAVMLLLEILTLTPFVMKTLGKKLFWPSKNTAGHKESKLWGHMAGFATKHPALTVGLVLLAILPMVVTYKEQLSFNLVGELGDSSDSSRGFNLVAEHFGEGQMMTTTVVIENTEALDSNEYLAVIDQLTENLKSVDGVDTVSSVTQPEGTKVEGFYLGNQLSSVASGMDQSEQGLASIYQGLEAAQETTGSEELSGVIDGLKSIGDGLDQTNNYLSGLAENNSFYMPAEALASESYATVLKMFLSEDRTIAKLTVVLSDDPYSEDAQDTIQDIRDTLSSTMKGSVLEQAKYGVAGTSANTSDTNQVLSSDLERTAVIVIIGVFLVLLLVIRSFWASIAVILSLIGSYFVAASAMNLIFIQIMGFEGISSFVPFFAFIVIVALGVDYSIFLMMRLKEYPDMPIQKAMIEACKQIGKVVISAIIILGGTFATLIPSGMVMLQELAVAVIVGLVVLCFVLLPLFIPAALALKGSLDEKNYHQYAQKKRMIEDSL